MQFWHVTFSSPTRLALFPTEAQLRRALAKIQAVAGAEVVLYGVVDDHLHLVLCCSEARAAALTRALRLALRPIAATEIGPAHRKPVDGRSYLQWLVRYLLLQVERHGIDAHPALWTGSCFQELVGARAPSPLPGQLARALPRLRLSAVQEIVGLPATRIEPVRLEQLRTLGARRLVEAAGAALLVGPELSGKVSRVMEAKRVVAQLGALAGLPSGEIAWALALPRPRISRLQRPAVDTRLVQAVRIRLALELLVASPSSRAGGGEAAASIR